MRPSGAVAALVLAGLGLAGPVGGQPAPAQDFSITATSSGAEQPTQMWVEQGPQRIPLTASGGAYVGSVPRSGVMTVRGANLVAEYGREQITLPVRFVPGKPAMILAIQNPELLPCVHARVAQLEAPGASYGAQLSAYYQARRLAQSRTCGPTMERRVVKAWFDRSYTLAKENDHIALDAEAAKALKAIPQHQAYARIMEQRMASRLVQLDYAYQMALLGAGEYAAAVEVNDALTERLQEDTTLASAAAEYQNLTVDRLQLDAVVLNERVTRATPE